MLTLLIVVPLTAALTVALLGRLGQAVMARRMALGAALVTVVLTALTWTSFDRSTAAFQFVERAAWLPAFGADYHLGVDGISLALVSMTVLLTPLALLASHWRDRHPVARDASVLVIEAACIAAFAARDLLLFYVSTEVMILPVLALIGIRGRDRRAHAATRCLLFSLTASMLTLLAFLWIAWRHQTATGTWTFALPDLLAFDIPPTVQGWAFLALIVACAIRMPVFPLHTWFADALARMPTAGGVMLAGVVVNVGGYGLLRHAFPLLPDAAAAAAPWLAILAVVGIVYGAVAAIAQDNLRRVVAYLAAGQMGLVVLGLASRTTEGLQGATFHLIAHGVWTTGLLLVIGMLAARRQTTRLSEFGGLRFVVPALSMAWLVMALASMGIPGAPGLMGAGLSLAGAAGSPLLAYGPTLAVAAGVGVILAGAGMWRVFWRVSLGPITRDRNRGLRDLTTRERVVLAPLGLLVVLLGFWPSLLLTVIEPATMASLASMVETVISTGP